MEADHTFESAVHRHDAQVAELGLPIWVGSEPTFTDREAQTPAWLHAALGDDKELRARALLGTVCGLMPGGLVLRSTGRLYPGEKLPRWNFGLLRRRDGEPLWNGPPDPLLAAEPAPAGPPDIAAFASALAEEFASQHWASECVETAEERGEEDADKEGADDTPAWTVTATADPDAEPLPFVLHAHEDKAEPDADRATCAAIELPEIASVELFLAILPCMEHAARACGLPALVFAGATPPVDATLELTTVTPDPAVIEINSAPSRNCAEFLWRSQQVYAAAAAHGLSPYRLYFNGQVADSGGAGQVTFGGPTPETSPFVSNLQLLPRLVRYFNRHPALSYLFCARLCRRQRPVRPAGRARHRCLRRSGAGPGAAGARNGHRARTAVEKPGLVPVRRGGQQPPRRDQHRKALEPATCPAVDAWAWSNFAACACSTRRSAPRPSPACCAPSSPCWPRAPTRCR
jgi:uncharacterized protein (DUF2126 family)